MKPSLDLLYSYSGAANYKDILKHLSPTFGESYLSSVSKNASKNFLTFYSDSGARVQKKFYEFSEDVEVIRKKIDQKSPAGHAIICIDENSYELLVYIVAALLEGRTLCPMNPREGFERIQKRIQTLPQKPSVFVGQAFESLRQSLSAESLELLPSPSENSKMVHPQPPKAFKDKQPFIFIFTSGTTGLSKIVQQTEIGVLTNIDALMERHLLIEPKRIGTCLPVYHVNALEFSFFSSLLSGGELVLFSSFDLPLMVDSISSSEIDILSIVPSLIYAFTKSAGMIPKNLFTQIRYVVTAAAPLPKALAKEFYETFHCRVVQGYGLSEAVNFSALNPIDLSEEDYRWSILSEARPSIGTAVRGGDIFILDENDKALGEGEVGELSLRGVNLMQGYVGESLEKTFQGSYFRTGDLGYYKKNHRGENFFFVTGRRKEIVKRFGVTVSLSEIEDELAAVPHKDFEAIAVGFPNDLAGEEVAVIIQSEAQNLNVERIAEHLRQRLPGHMRPRLFFITDRAVRGPSGKSKRGDFAHDLLKYQDVRFSDKDVFVKEKL